MSSPSLSKKIPESNTEETNSTSASTSKQPDNSEPSQSTSLLPNACSQATTTSPISSNTIPSTSSSGLQLPNPNPKLHRLQIQINQLKVDIGLTKSEISRSLTDLSGHLPKDPTENSSTTEDVLLHESKKITTQHITLLHRYNEIKDVSMGLLGLIADRDGKRVVEVMREWGVDEKD